jgi:flagellar hook-basal body complex protein FliE
MTQPIGDSTSSARSAIESALRRHADGVARARAAADPASAEAARPAGFSEMLEGGIEKLDATVRGHDRLVDDFVSGKVEDFHEIALRLKQSELSFRFTMEVRNKLVDAYREVMRMSV